MYRPLVFIVLLFTVFCTSCELFERLPERGNVDSKPDPIKLKSCYEKMIEELEPDFTGTACDVCFEGSFNAGDTIVVYSAFFSDPEVLSRADDYKVRWELKGNGGEIIGSDTMRYVLIHLNESSSDSLLAFSYNETIEQTTFGIPNSSCSDAYDLSY